MNAATAGLGTMLRIHTRANRRALLTWVLVLAATMGATAGSIHDLYNTPEKTRSYADAVQSGDAMVVINGRVAGVDTLGGVIANEFGFVASFLIPFMAVTLIARMTRREEERGRLEALLAGRIGRAAPLASAVLVTASALALVALSFFGAYAAVGVPAADAALYAASMLGLGLTFTGVAACAAQLVERSHGVNGIGLGAIVAAYLLRGIGDVSFGPLAWISPLGWQEETRAFGDARWWPLLLPIAATGVLVGLALATALRRDLGAAPFKRGAVAPGASAFLRSPAGLALRTHRGSILGWAAVTAVVMGVFGALAQPLTDAIEGNPDIATVMGGSNGTGTDAVVALSVLVLALLTAGYAVQAGDIVRGEETGGRLEAHLFGDRSRWTWFGVHSLVILLGTAAVAAVGAAGFAAAATASTGESMAGTVAEATVDMLPAVAVLGALALALFGVRPRLQSLAWFAYGAAALIAYLGDPLDLPDAVNDLSPFKLVGSPPLDTAAPATLAGMVAAAALLVAVGFVGLRNRGVPQN